MPETNDQMTAPQAYTINDVLREIRLKSVTEREKGADFERLMQRWFLTDPRYENLTKVWMWNEFPAKNELGGVDLGIDLVAKTDLGDYWAIQCKCYDEDATIDKRALDSFLSNASRGFTDEETFQRKTFSNLIWVSTTKTWGQNAEKAVQNLNVPFTRINIHDLENSPVDWRKLVHGTKGKDAKLPGKQPRKHQLVAIGKAYEHYITNGNERGKLIMACGTGKTYTALRIMETMTAKDATVLFFVPSIALLSQTHVAWMADKTDPMRAICICSDNKVGTIGANGGLFTNNADPEEDILADSIIDQACPASTNVATILRQINKAKKDKVRTVIMSTYQSIDVVIDAMRQAKITADLCICDEAHRTTGVKIKDEDPSPFTKVHDNGLIPARKRLYMTATPRLYRESVKIKAKENDDVLCSMDDEKIYGKEFHRLGFNDAVNQNLLTDYKVLVLTVSESDIPENIQNKIKDTQTNLNGAEKLKELNFDDATKLIGCINGLSKRLRGDDGVTREQDPTFIHRAVAFCQTINPTAKNPTAASKTIALHFPQLCKEYKRSLTDEVKKEVVTVEAAHIDGSMNANERNKLITWLKEDTGDDNVCRVLCNVRCLSEGVDVPALDAVLFLSPRKSEVEVVQSVGRVMRSFGKGTAHEKKYGYIIIPVIVPEDVKPEAALNDNERFKVVWTILNALRSHDENFNAHVNQIALNKKRSSKVTVAGVAGMAGVTGYSIGEEGQGKKLEGGDAVAYSNEEISRQLSLRFGELQDGIYARIVEKVGDKMYWENWAGEVGQIAKKYMERISKLVHDEEGKQKEEFDEFVKTLQQNLNPGITPDQCIEMLAQHLITRPVFETLFSDYKFVSNNSISSSMEFMIEYLRNEAVDSDLDPLQSFYDSVRVNVGNIDNLEGKQTIIKNLYEKFFKRAFPQTVETLGTVYTPVECVDFIIHSVDAVLKKEFGTALTNDNVHILDPFTGTGTFITRLLQSGVIRKEDLLRKYSEEIHCNEIVLLAYYVADVNIEAVFHDRYSQEEYVPFDGICLTDTFQLGETDGKEDIFGNFFKENSLAVERQKMAPIRVIIGNPPYSIGQKSQNDNAQNQHYPKLEQRITDTYAAQSNANLLMALYDSYIKAFRWSTDRIDKNGGGILAFISNGSWIDGISHDGFRATLTKDFDKIYVLNLRGNCRTSGELRRKEKDNVFGMGTRTTVAITVLVKYPEERHSSDCEIYYHDIGDYLSREQKLEIIKKFKSIEGINWDKIVPNEKNDWINQRDGLFDNLIPLMPTKKIDLKSQSVFSIVSPGIKTNRDVWMYGFSKDVVGNNMSSMIDFYNKQLGKEPSNDERKISWTVNLLKDLEKKTQYEFDGSAFTTAVYRPFTKMVLYNHKPFVERPAKWENIFSINHSENMFICVPGIGNSKDFSCLITNTITDYSLVNCDEVLPLYWYEENKNKQSNLFDAGSEDDFIRRDGITDWILREFRTRYGTRNISKEDIFFYVYGLLHSPDYRERFADDLRKALPRIPIVENVYDYVDFVRAGRKLADLHLNYETVPPCPDVIVSGLENAPVGDAEYDYFRIPDKMRFASKTDKSTIVYNGNIVVSNIPQRAYDYVVNGKSAIDWLLERYQVTQDTKSLIRNDCNDWAREHGQPRYILDLLLSIINVSVQTADLVATLPTLTFPSA